MNTWENHLADQIDWSNPDLADIPSRDREALPRDRLCVVVNRIRRHPDEYFGFSTGFFDQLRTSSTPAEIEQARQAVDAALERDLFFPPHNNAFAALGAETLHLGIDEARAARMAQRVLERQADWARTVWMFGITHGVANLLRFLCPHRAVKDEHLLPLFGWLCAIAPVEWQAARGWTERTLGCSGHNWYVHSFFGFWMAGALFPHVKGLKPYAALAPTYLEREAHLLFAEDGWSKEGSASYHRFAALNLIEFARLAERHGVEFRPAFRAKLRTIADATWRMQAPDGDAALFGDAAPAKPRAERRKPTRGRAVAPHEIMRRLAARFGLSQAKGALEQLEPNAPPPKFLPLHGDNLAGAWAALRSEPPPLDTALPYTGLFAMRSNWSSSGDWLAINATTIGPVVSSHMHADIFNIEICVRGRRVLQDNWYGDFTADDGSYKSSPEIRNAPMKRRWRVGSTAHNVATVNNEDQVPVQRVYRYGWHERPFVEAFVSAERYSYFSGVHEAYRRLTAPVVAHRRSIFYLRGEYWVLIDRFTVDGEQERSFQQHFHLLKGAEVLSNGQVRTHGAEGNLLLVPVTGLTGKLAIEPNPHPIGSYQNPDHVTIETASNGNAIMAVLLVPFEGEDVPAVTANAETVECDGRQQGPWEASGIRIRVGERSDFFFKQHMHWNLAWRGAGHQGTGRLFHSRVGEVADHGIADDGGRRGQ